MGTFIEPKIFNKLAGLLERYFLAKAAWDEAERRSNELMQRLLPTKPVSMKTEEELRAYFDAWSKIGKDLNSLSKIYINFEFGAKIELLNAIPITDVFLKVIVKGQAWAVAKYKTCNGREELYIREWSEDLHKYIL
jgi:hypothetical protein